VAVGTLALAASRVVRVEVRGLSMLPELAPGDRLVALRGRRGLRPGHLVVARDPRQGARTLVKRVAEAGGPGLVLLGDNPGASTDSRDFGPVPRRLVVGRVVYRYWPAARAGRL